MKVACPQCQKKYKLPPHAEGKQVTCRECSHRFLSDSAVISSGNVQATASGTKRTARRAAAMPAEELEDGLLPLPPSRRELARKNAVSPERLSKELAGAFRGEFTRPRVTMAHRLVGAIVALLMLLLPVIYLGLIVGIGYATYWHVMNNWVWVVNVRGGRVTLIVASVYVAIGFAGALWVFSLLRPLMYFGGRSEERTGLSREDEPVLFAFTDRLADVVGSPRPDVINLSLDVNASASFRTAWFGLQRKQFCLTLGIPLLAGMSLNQVAGVIAHEFGHFSQTGSIFLDRTIRRINFWFAHAVYARSDIDEYIDALTHDGDGNVLVMLFGFLVLLLVGSGKVVLWCLMMLGHAVSSTLMRRMEYDADRYEIGVVGSDVFKATSARLIELGLANEIAGDLAFNTNRGDHLPKNFPEFTAAIADQDPRVAKKARKLIKKEQSSWFASHPTTAARVRVAERLKEPGIFDVKHPASALVTGFRSKSKDITRTLYQYRYGESFDPASMRNTSEAIEAYESVFGQAKT